MTNNSEATTDEVPAETRSSTRKRNLIIASTVVPVAALFALLGWGITHSEGSPGGFGINSKFGQVSVGNVPAPEFVAQTLDGKQIELSGLEGKLVMVDFWSSWCPPCRREAADLAQVYREYEGREVEFIGVAIWDHADDVGKYIEEFDITYPNLIDDKGKIAITYGVTGIPEKLFIDAEGKMVRKFVGPMTPEALMAILDELLPPTYTKADGDGI